MDKSQKVVVLLCTVPNRDTGLKIARFLVSEKLVACVNIIPSIVSVYEWEGKMEEDNEELLVLKTRKDNVASVTSAIKTLHSYKTPEVIALELLDEGNHDYIQWVISQTSKKKN